MSIGKQKTTQTAVIPVKIKDSFLETKLTFLSRIKKLS